MPIKPFIINDKISVAISEKLDPTNPDQVYTINIPEIAIDWDGNEVKVIGSTVQVTRKLLQMQIDRMNEDIDSFNNQLTSLKSQMDMINQMEA